VRLRPRLEEEKIPNFWDSIFFLLSRNLFADLWSDVFCLGEEERRLFLRKNVCFSSFRGCVWFGFRLCCFFFCVVVFGRRFVTTLLVFEAAFQVWLAFHWLLGCGLGWL
jgi:hypothetical protein